MMHRGKLLFCDPLDDVKGAHWRVTLRFAAPRESPPPLDGALAWEPGTREAGGGEHWTAVCSGRREQIEAAAAVLGARIVRESALSLDEIFVARSTAGAGR
jgi:ABC-2 type transport system ATP-binding protein